MILSTKENSSSCNVTSGLALSADKSYIDCDAVVNMEKKSSEFTTAGAERIQRDVIDVIPGWVS